MNIAYDFHKFNFVTRGRD